MRINKRKGPCFYPGSHSVFSSEEDDAMKKKGFHKVGRSGDREKGPPMVDEMYGIE